MTKDEEIFVEATVVHDFKIRAATIAELRRGAAERVAQYLEDYEGYQGSYALVVGKRIVDAILGPEAK